MHKGSIFFMKTKKTKKTETKTNKKKPPRCGEVNEL